MSELALEICGLSKHFDEVRALDDASFDVPAGTVFGLLGPNGAGKTTLFSIVANFLRPTAGHARALGVPVDDIDSLRGRLSILPQDALFQNSVPILDQMVFLMRLAGKDRREAEAEVREKLAAVGLENVADSGAHTLSHGMYRRLGIAQALLGDPELIILDEPTGGLDPHSARQVRDLIRDLRGESTVILSSHNLAEVQDLCSHVAILDHGKIVTCAPVGEITSSGQSVELTLSRELDESEGHRLKAIPGVRAIEILGPQRYKVNLDLTGESSDPDAMVRAVLALLLELEITPREVSQGTSLEEHFLRVTGPSKR